MFIQVFIYVLTRTQGVCVCVLVWVCVPRDS